MIFPSSKYYRKFLAPLALCLCIGNHGYGQVISTIAGNGTAGFLGESAPATDAELNQPFGIKADNAGNVYFADNANERVRKISSTGIITTVAGGGSSGVGDGGPATDAQIQGPVGLVFDAMGNLYVSDFGHDRIRKIDVSGNITTVAGTGIGGYTGDGGAATLAQINYPNGMAIDVHGNIYFTEEINHRVRKIDTAGIITTIAGSGPSGLGLGTYSGDGGPATLARLNRPYGVFVDRHSNVFIADGWNNRVRRVDTAGNISTVAGGGSMGGVNIPATAASLNVIIDVAVDTSGNLYISEGNGCRILLVNTSGILKTIAGDGTCAFSGEGVIDTTAQVNHPGGVALSSCGNIYIADWGNNRVRKVTYCSPDTAVTTNVNNYRPSENALQVYPNPNYGTFNIRLSSGADEPATVSVTNIFGQKVAGYTSTTNVLIDAKIQIPGLYFIKASSLRESIETKVIVR